MAPLGVSTPRLRTRDRGAVIELPAGVTTPFLLHVGDLHERRNLAVVVDALLGRAPAFRRGGRRCRSCWPASIAASAMGSVRIAADAGASEAVVLLGRVE